MHLGQKSQSITQGGRDDSFHEIPTVQTPDDGMHFKLNGDDLKEETRKTIEEQEQKTSVLSPNLVKMFRMILSEYLQCFPQDGEIKIKRKIFIAYHFLHNPNSSKWTTGNPLIVKFLTEMTKVCFGKCFGSLFFQNLFVFLFLFLGYGIGKSEQI